MPNDTLWHAVLWVVTLGVKPVYSFYPGRFGPVPDTPIIYYNPQYANDSKYDRYIEAVFLGAPNFDPKAVDIESLRLNGTKAASTSIADANGDGIPDLVMRFIVRQLIAERHLAPGSKQLTASGRYRTGTLLTDTSPVTICTNVKDCPADNTVGAR